MPSSKYGLFVFVPTRERPLWLDLDIAVWNDDRKAKAGIEEMLRRHQAGTPEERLAPGTYRAEAHVGHSRSYTRCLTVFWLTIAQDGEPELSFV